MHQLPYPGGYGSKPLCLCDDTTCPAVNECFSRIKSAVGLDFELFLVFVYNQPGRRKIKGLWNTQGDFMRAFILYKYRTETATLIVYGYNALQNSFSWP